MRLSVAVAAVCLSLVGLCAADDSTAAIRKPTNIPAEGLVPALKQLAHERNLQVVFQSEVVGTTQTHGAAGELTTQEALSKLLEGTNLVYRFLDDKTITIFPASAAEGSGAAPSQPSSAPAPTSSSQKEAANSGAFLLAQAAQGQAASNTALEAQQKRAASSEVPLQEIIVTAQKREQRAFDVPISIVAIGADELEKRRVTNIDDLSFVVPGLAVSSVGSSSNHQITLRGVSDQIGNSSQVGMYLDEASITSNSATQIDLRTYDLERVEVLRGPQGTLYGEGSVGGTIRFITKNPQLDTFAMNSDVRALVTQDGAPSQRIDEVVNVPLVENTLALRVAGTFDHEGGWIDQPAADRKNFNDQNLVNVRVKGLWQATPQFSVNAMAVIHRNDTAPNMGEDTNGNFTQTFNLTTTPSTRDTYNLYNLTLTYDFPAIRVLSSSSYLEQDLETKNIGTRVQILPPGVFPPFDIDQLQQTVTVKSATEELRLMSVGAEPWQWTIGGFYRDLRFDNDIPATIVGFPGPPGTPLPAPFASDANNRSKSWAAFGDTSYKVANRLTIGAGLRYFKDDQGQTAPAQSARFDDVSPRAYLQYTWAADANTYASVAKGFRSGGFNPSPAEPSYGPESVWTYELGTKLNLLERQLGVDAAVFYSKYTNYQTVGLTSPTAIISVFSNAGDAVIKGVEADVTWRPANRWTLSLAGDYLDSYFTTINLVPSSSAYFVGDNLDFVPKYQYMVSAQRDLTWGDKPGYVRLDYAQRGPETLRNRSVGPWYYGETDVIHMLNLNTGLQWNESLFLGLFAQNLLNDRSFLSPAFLLQSAARSRPRTLGVEFSVKF